MCDQTARANRLLQHKLLIAIRTQSLALCRSHHILRCAIGCSLPGYPPATAVPVLFIIFYRFTSALFARRPFSSLYPVSGVSSLHRVSVESRRRLGRDSAETQPRLTEIESPGPKYQLNNHPALRRIRHIFMGTALENQ